MVLYGSMFYYVLSVLWCSPEARVTELRNPTQCSLRHQSYQCAPCPKASECRAYHWFWLDWRVYQVYHIDLRLSIIVRLHARTIARLLLLSFIEKCARPTRVQRTSNLQQIIQGCQHLKHLRVYECLHGHVVWRCSMYSHVCHHRSLPTKACSNTAVQKRKWGVAPKLQFISVFEQLDNVMAADNKPFSILRGTVRRHAPWTG